MFYLFLLSKLKLNSAVSEQISRSDQTNECAHIYGSSTARFAVLKGELLSPIKDACHVYAVYACLLVLLWPSGLSQINEHEVWTNMLHTHMHTRTLPRAVWSIRVNVTDVWKAPMRPNAFMSLLTATTQTLSNPHLLIHTPRAVVSVSDSVFTTWLLCGTCCVSLHTNGDTHNSSPHTQSFSFHLRPH